MPEAWLVSNLALPFHCIMQIWVSKQTGHHNHKSSAVTKWKIPKMNVQKKASIKEKGARHLNVFLVVRGPELDTVLNVSPHQCQVQRDNHFSGPAGHTISDTGQDAIGLLGHLVTLLAHVQMAVDQHPQVLFHWDSLQTLFPQPVALHGVIVTKGQDPAPDRIESHTVCLGPSILPVQIPLQSLSAFQQINIPAQLGKLIEVALDPLIQFINKILNRTRPKTESPLNTTSDANWMWQSSAPLSGPGYPASF
ncbi:hypothetical protein BTVI_67559 [Pitangus sulphuratus]|nr:hypothetical protein BTVI_67559 [Pitangus sulphuratus]